MNSEQKFNETFDLWIETAHKENIKNFGALAANMLKPTLLAMREVNKMFFEEGMELAKENATPDGFKLVSFKQISELVVVDANLLAEKIEKLTGANA